MRDSKANALRSGLRFGTAALLAGSVLLGWQMLPGCGPPHSRPGRRPANAELVLIARGSLDGKLKPVG